MVHNLVWAVGGGEGAPEETVSMLNFEECVRINQMNNNDNNNNERKHLLVTAICQAVF